MNNKGVVLKLQEGAGANYLNLLYTAFGGELNKDTYTLVNENSNILLQTIEVLKGMELVITDAIHHQSVAVERTANDDPDYIHISFFKQGQVPHLIKDDKLFTEADTLLGAYMHNGLFPFKTVFPANMRLKTITYKVTKEALLLLLPECERMYNNIFSNDKGIAYHIPLSTQVERLTDDIFYFNELEFGRTAYIKARAIEALCVFMENVQTHLDSGTLKGLRKEDYSKLLKIKDKLVSSFNQKITIQALAEEFGFSVSKLKRDFKTLFDCSIYQFYTHAKMDEAYRLLRLGNQTVMEVGYDLGYSNLSKFSEMFKKVKGILPNEVARVNLV